MLGLFLFKHAFMLAIVFEYVYTIICQQQKGKFQMITYKAPKLVVMLKVLVDGNQVGKIIKENDRYFYKPNGTASRGEYFNTVAEVKYSIEEK